MAFLFKGDQAYYKRNEKGVKRNAAQYLVLMYVYYANSRDRNMKVNAFACKN